MMAKITVLGMGAMGSRMAMSLLNAEHEVTVWNRSAGKADSIVQAGAKLAKTPRAAVKNAEFVISMVRDDGASKQVWLDPDTGAMAGLSKDVVAIESSTLTLAWTKELGRKFEANNIAFVDAPVAGTRPQVESAQLIYFVGGEATVFAKVEPILQMMGSIVHHVGTVGNGMAIKLGVNSLFALQVAAFGELIGLMNGCGLDKKKAVEVLASTPVCSPAAKMAATAMVAGKFSPLFPIELVEKDLSYAVQTARMNNVTLPLVEATRSVFTKAITQGYGENNITGVVRLYDRL